MLTNITGSFKNLFNLFRGVRTQDDDVLPTSFAIPIALEARRELGFVPLTVMRGRLLITENGNSTRITTNTTTVLSATIPQKYSINVIIINVAGTGSTATFRDNGGNTVFVIDTATAGVVDVGGTNVHDVVTAGTAAADITLLGHDDGDINSNLSTPLS